jgi:predicted ATP-dependent endonuclease of OLD family
MKINKIHIHNFRSIADAEFNLDNYNLLVGENGAGKTTIITAIRTFYEDGGMKFLESRDFPKMKVSDSESWMDFTFLTTDDEQDNLKVEYKSDDKLLKVRKYFKSSNKSYNSNFYAYVNGVLTHENQFYGDNNVGKSKFGKLLYIPALSKTDEGLKMSGPSHLRNIVDFIFEKRIKGNESFTSLENAFSTFNEEVTKERDEDDFSIYNLTRDVNGELEQFGLGIKIDVNQIKPNDIIKNLISHKFLDENLHDTTIDDVNTLGQGVQRHLIYTLIKLSVKYSDKKKEKKKEFQPDFTLLLFEEPEAFLHPSQQEQLNISLGEIGEEDDRQVLITTHSSTFVSKNTNEITNIIRVNKEGATSKLFQLTKNGLDDLFNKNLGLYSHFCNLLSNTTDQSLIKKYERLGDALPNPTKKLEEETLRYFLWLDTERASLFFAKHIIICEGASERILLDLLIQQEWKELKKRHIYFLDALGKFNIHRYMNLLGDLGIRHSVLMDSDNDPNIQSEVNSFILSRKNCFTHKVDTFQGDLETFLGISKPSRDRNDLKPLNVIQNYKNNQIQPQRIAELKAKIISLID